MRYFSFSFFLIRVNKQFHNRLRLADSYCTRFIFSAARFFSSCRGCAREGKKLITQIFTFIIANRLNTEQFDSNLASTKNEKRIIIYNVIVWTKCGHRFTLPFSLPLCLSLSALYERPSFWKFNQINVWSDFFRHLQWRTVTHILVHTRIEHINVYCVRIETYTWSVCRPRVCIGAYFEKSKNKNEKQNPTRLKWNARWYHR